EFETWTNMNAVVYHGSQHSRDIIQQYEIYYAKQHSRLHALRMEHRVLLTGTPLQNNIEELFSLLNFLHPQQFSSSAAFLDQFGQCQSDEQVQKLQEILKPMMLRRLKEDVEKSLQPKEETIIELMYPKNMGS
ncbi:hypothetical protein DICVIV_14323, partial [Dictyocaulus viviparus]